MRVNGRCRSTGVPHTGIDVEHTKALKRSALEIYHATLTDQARARAQLPSLTSADVPRFETFAGWYETHVTAHKRGAVREREILKTLTAAFGSVRLDALTRDQVQEWMTARRAKVSPGTVNRELDVLKHLLSQAVPQHLPASPLVRLRRLYQPRQAMRVLTHADERRLLAVLSLPDRALVVMALDTLMRLGDIVNFERSHDHGTYLTVLNPKTREPYRVPISRRLRKLLDALPDAGPFYFAHRRQAHAPRDYRGSVQSMLERACKKAKVKYGRTGGGLTFHLLRHTGASRMVAAGIDLRTVQEIGGWSSLRQLVRYTHPTDAAKRRAVDVVGRVAST